MALTPVPDLRSRTAFLKAVVIGAAITIVAVLIRAWPDNMAPFGDTDATLRLVVVRDFLARWAWFDTHIARLQPPLGLDSHWSRLMDAGLAAIAVPAAALFGAAAGERIMWTLWPLLLLPVLMLGCMLSARRLGGSSAVVCLVFPLLISAILSHYRPGNIDHHGLQFALTALALAGALHLDRRWGPSLCGAASAMLLAVGLEAILFAAIMGAAVALRTLIVADLPGAARRYGLALLITTLAAYLLQTAPSRWLLSACDALAANLVAALVLAGLAIAAASMVPPTRMMLRACAGGLGAALAAGTYLGLDPACATGPFGEMDPRLRPIWLDHVMEVLPLATLWRDTPQTAVLMMAAPLIGFVLLLLALALRGAWRDGGWIMTAALLLSALALGVDAARMLTYAALFGVIATAGALPLLFPRITRTVAGSLLCAAVLSPLAIFVAVGFRQDASATAASTDGGPKTCQKPALFAALAGLPPGLVLAPIDLGPALLAHTPHDVLAAPYHRMAWGLVSAHEAWSAPADTAAADLRGLGVQYVVLCSMLEESLRFPDRSLQQALRRGKTPSGLKQLTPRGEALTVWGVEPTP